MKSIFPILLAMFASLSFASTPEETLNAFHQALAQGDATTAAGHLSPDVTIYESGHVERSRAEYVNHHLASDIAFAKVTQRKVLKKDEKTSGNLAVIWEETETSGKYQGKDIHLLGTSTLLLEKKENAWVITHIHWSSRKASK